MRIASVQGWSMVEARIASMLNAASSLDMDIVNSKDSNKQKVIKTAQNGWLGRSGIS